MKLGAHFAAKRFASRFAGRERRARSRWSSLSLRWRRARRPALMQTLRNSSPSFTQSWFSQFHLHFTTAGKEGEHRLLAAPAMRSVATRHRSRGQSMVVQGVIARAASRFTPALFPVQWRQRDVMARERISRQWQHLHTASRLELRRTERTSVSGPEFRRSVHFRTTVRRPNLDAGEAKRAAHHHGNPLPHAFLQWRREAQPQRLPEPTSRRVTPPPLRPPELVWRKPEKIDVELASEHTSGGISPASTSSPQVSRSNPPQQMAGQAPSTAETRAMVLDSATVDRLADDVIRRVERHIRIERERRGV